MTNNNNKPNNNDHKWPFLGLFNYYSQIYECQLIIINNNNDDTY